MHKVAVFVSACALLSVSAFAAEPSLQELQLRLELVKGKREAVVIEYRYGKAMMDLAVMKETALMAEEQALTAQIEEMKKKTKDRGEKK